MTGRAAGWLRRRRRGTLVLCCLVVVGGIAAGVLLGGSPGSRAAAAQGRAGTSIVSAGFGSQGTLREAHGRFARFELRGGHGPKIDVYAALEGAGSPIGVTMEGRDGRIEYMARGFADARRLQASFAGFGEVDLAFRPSGKVLRAPTTDSSCPAGATARIGTFTGKFSFRARDGGPSADARRIGGSVGTPETPVEERKGSPLTCNFPEPLYRVPMRAEQEKGKPLLLAVESSIPRGRVALEVAPFLVRRESAEFRSPPGKPLIVAAGVREVVEGVTITGIALGGGPEKKILEVSAGGAEAVLTPGPPFSGSATYAGEGSWTGDLRLSIPGLGTTALAGAGFEATFSGPR